ncbi:hypothetical protein KP509_18G058300 [Ceratopteris richardii]|nr:hypothetical protein KP509_18G058300 [Ceratopteris richardii]
MVYCSHVHGNKQSQRASVKRRILKSQWYGNSLSDSWEHKGFQMRISEFPKYPLLEVDGDKQLVRFRSGNAAAFAERDRRPSQKTADKQPSKQAMHGIEVNQSSALKKPLGHPIRQTILGNNELPRKHLGLINTQANRNLNIGNSAFRSSEVAEEFKDTTPQPRLPRYKMRKAHDSVRDITFKQERPSMNTPKSGQWGKDDELDLEERIQKLYRTIEAVEQNRRAAMLALEEERQRSLALEREMSKQREVASMLGEEVRLLKESHNALLTSLRRKYSTTAAARTAADLVYQDWERQAAAD